MTDEMDRLLRQIADSPLPRTLDRLEADVLNRIGSSRADVMAAPSWRVAAVGVALIVGIGVGAGSTVVARDASGSLAQALSGGDHAPSNLLATS